MASSRVAGESIGSPHTADGGYRHEAFPYAGHDEFVALAADFLAAGVAAGEAGLLLSRGRGLVDVRDALDDDARHVSFVDMDAVGRNPALTFSLLEDFATAHGGARVRGLGEPVHDGRSAAHLVETELHELLLNTPVCRDWNMWLGCPYDTAALDADRLAAMRESHPGDGRDLSNLAAAKFADPLPPRPADAQLFPVDPNGLAGVRSVVRTAARMAGLSEQRAEDFVCAVNEVVTNSIEHGRGSAEFALWATGDSLVCEVHDGGRIRDPFAGRRPPAIGGFGGRGLWLANHLCDLVQVRAPESGTSVRMHIER